MKLESFQDLKRVLDLCRKAGVETIKIDNVEFTLGAAPEVPKRSSRKSRELSSIAPGGITDQTEVLADGLPSYESLLFYSSDVSPTEQN